MSVARTPCEQDGLSTLRCRRHADDQARGRDDPIKRLVPTSGGGDVVGIGSSDEGLGLRLLLGERAVDGGLEATSEIHQERWPFWRNGGNLAP